MDLLLLPHFPYIFRRNYDVLFDLSDVLVCALLGSIVLLQHRCGLDSVGFSPTLAVSRGLRLVNEYIAASLFSIVLTCFV